MDLDRHVVRPITEETGARAAFSACWSDPWRESSHRAAPLVVRVFDWTRRVERTLRFQAWRPPARSAQGFFGH